MTWTHIYEFVQILWKCIFNQLKTWKIKNTSSHSTARQVPSSQKCTYAAVNAQTKTVPPSCRQPHRKNPVTCGKFFIVFFFSSKKFRQKNEPVLLESLLKYMRLHYSWDIETLFSEIWIERDQKFNKFKSLLLPPLISLFHIFSDACADKIFSGTWNMPPKSGIVIPFGRVQQQSLYGERL